LIDHHQLDLHGETRDFARILVKDFIQESYKMGYSEVVIIHGLGEGILKKVVQEVLKNHPKVEEFYLDFFNVGQTIVKLKKNV